VNDDSTDDVRGSGRCLCNALSRNSDEGIEENNENPQSG
jgi:hypothetical protein